MPNCVTQGVFNPLGDSLIHARLAGVGNLSEQGAGNGVYPESLAERGLYGFRVSDQELKLVLDGFGLQFILGDCRLHAARVSDLNVVCVEQIHCLSLPSHDFCRRTRTRNRGLLREHT